jgi:hypothetical protein
MKIFKIITLGLLFLTTTTIWAQVSINVNIGTPPSWGPSGNSDAEYYYLPDVESYYDVRATQFIFISNGQWIRSRYLPRRYRNYDLQHGQKVVLNDYHGKQPYVYFKNHRERYNRSYKSQDEPQRNVGMREEEHEGHGGKEHEGKGHGKERD